MIRSFSRVVSSRHRKRSTYAAVARRLPIAAQTYLSSPSSRPLSPSSHSWIPLYLFESRQQFRTSLFATSDLHSTNEYSLILEGLNPSQVEAVTQPNKAVIRVIAGPGSGKTRVLTCRVAYLLKQDPHAQVLAVTFTKKAAEEMRQRVERLLVQQQGQEMPSIQHLDSEVIQQDTSGSTPNDLRRITMGTFHSICAKILRFNGDLLQSLPSVEDDMVGRQEASVNLDGSFAILDASDQLRILKECLDETKIDLKNSSVKPLQILTAIGTIKEALALGKDPLNEFDESKKPIPRPLKYARDIYSLYRGKLLSNNALDFDDLILMTREILIMFPELRERLHRRWPHVLIDEFQDTSRIQMDLVKLLTSSSLLVVGDADQAIYSWRGAHAGSLSDFRTEFEDFTEEGVHTVYLKENYRSTSNIVQAAEKVISSASVSSNKGNDELRRAMKPKRGSGPSPRVVACADERREAEFVVDTIFQMIADFSLGPESTAAIIYRTNAQSRYLEEACVARNLPYVIRGGAGGFYKRAEVKDCLCFLRWLYNGNDESAMIRAFKTPSRGLGDKAIVEFKEYCTAVDNFYRESMTGSARPSKLDVLTSMVDLEEGYKMFLAQGTPEPSEYISKRALNNFLPFAAQMSIIRAKAFVVPVDSLLFFIIEALNLISHFDSISKSKAEFEERRENVQELRQATKRYSSGGPALVDKGPRVMDLDDFDDGSPLGHFLDDVSLVSDIAPDNAESKDARFVVNLMTIHASKGMEFDAVFVVGNEEGTLPSSLSLQEGENSIALEEERRLCYVAMTRAKTRLILSWRKEVSTFASWSADGPRTVTKSRSRFLDSLVKSNSGDKKVPMKSREAKEDNPYRPLQQRKSLTSSVSHRKRSDIDQIYPEKPHLVPKRPPSSSQKSFSERGPTPRHIDRDMPTSPRKAHNRIPADLSIKSPATRPYSNSKTPADRQDSKSMLKAKANQGTSIPFDSTLFYPVGSDVIHNNFGRGMVLEPPPISSVSGKLLVRVQFENGRTMEFPVEGSDLIPVF